MKNFKRLLAAGVAAVMVFALAGCGGKEEVALEGTWNADVDATQIFGESFDGGMDTEIKFSDYIPDMTEKLSITFNADGTYEFTDETEVDIAAFQDAYVQYLTDVLTADNGGEALTDEDLIEVFGTADLKEATAELFTDEEMDALFGTQTETGSYTNTDGSIELESGIKGTFADGVLTMDLTDLIDISSVVFTKA